MNITREQYNAVITGLRTQLELQRAFNQEEVEKTNAANKQLSEAHQKILGLRENLSIAYSEISNLKQPKIKKSK